MKSILLFFSAVVFLSGAVLVDRIAVIIGRQVIKSSDIDRDLRVTDFINRQPIDLTPAARRKAAQRLVDQQLIRRELSEQGYARPAESDAEALLKQITRDRFHGSDPQLRAALARYGLTRDVLRDHLLWQLTVLRFIDQRFRPGILVTDEEVQAYYNQHAAELKRQYPKDSSLAALSPEIKTLLEAQQVDKEFDSWLDEERKRNRIEYKEAAFQ